MSEDFGWSGDEFLLGDCQDDWQMYMPDRFDTRRGQRKLEEIQRQELDELALEFLEEGGEESDLSDIVREHDEREDWQNPDDPSDEDNCLDLDYDYREE